MVCGAFFYTDHDPDLDRAGCLAVCGWTSRAVASGLARRPRRVRVEVLVVLYDQRSGQPAWWQVATVRYIQEMKAQPSRAEMDQYLLWAEDDIEEQLKRGCIK